MAVTQVFNDASSSSEDEDEDVNWIDLLPFHPIFALPNEQLANGDVPLPASPNLSAIGRDDASELSHVLSGLDQLKVNHANQPIRQSIMVVVRSTELVVAVGKELRIASLADVKSKAAREASNQAGPSSAVGSYKVCVHMKQVRSSLNLSVSRSSILQPSISKSCL